VGTTERISAQARLYDGAIARNTTRDHALGRGPYRQLRRRGGGGLRGRLAVVPPVVLALVIATLALAGFGAVTAFAFFASDLPSPEDLAKDPLAQSTKVYDRDGATLLYQFEVERREVVSLSSIPQVVIDATVAAEDKSFWTNPGIDVFGIARAVRDDLLHKDVVSGASTITQQLVKQRIVGDEVSVSRKIKEAILAVQVTRTYSKEQILELYFNQIYYGNQAYGIKAAAQTYFGKADLSRSRSRSPRSSPACRSHRRSSIPRRPTTSSARRTAGRTCSIRWSTLVRSRPRSATRPTRRRSRSPVRRSRPSPRRTSCSRSATSLRRSWAGTSRP
jgi:hypothetical protein